MQEREREYARKQPEISDNALQCSTIGLDWMAWMDHNPSLSPLQSKAHLTFEFITTFES